MNEKGAFGEDFAKNYFIENNYTILKKNYYSRFGEIDLILKKDEYIPTLPMLVLMGAYKYEINKALKYVGGEAIKEDRYWSSTEVSANGAWYVYMSNGVVYSNLKNLMYHVRPVSAFSL